MAREYQRCTHCVMDTTDSKIVFDENGVCDHCNNFKNNILPTWKYGEGREKELQETLDKIKAYGKGKKYDCIIGLSGGIDSSYMAYMAVKKWGLRPLLYCVDTGWDLPVAKENIEKIISKLGCDVYRDKIDFEQIAGLQLAFFKSQVAYQDIVQDQCIFAALYNYAASQGVQYVLNGGNFSTEGVREPDEWVHTNDLRMLKDIHKKFGEKPIDKLPLCGMFRKNLYYRYFKKMHVVKPLDLVPYHKEEVLQTLKDEFDWVPYKNKHYESLFTRFYEGYWLYEKFGYDKRKAYFSSLINTNQMTREEALALLEERPYPLEQAMEDMSEICKRMGITVEEFQELMKGENKTYKDYKSDKKIIDAAVKLAQFVGLEKRNFR